MTNKSKFYQHKDKDKGKEKRTYDGILFDSELEMKYYRDVLLPMKDKGIIHEVKLQPEYLLLEAIEHFGRKYNKVIYKGDFAVDGNVVVDVKGTYGYNIADQVAILKRKLFAARYPNIQLNWITYCKKYGGWLSWDDYNMLNRAEKRARKVEKNL